jgi:hypothetical protein
MIRVSQIVPIFILVIFAGCSKNISASATIRVTCCDSAKSMTSEYLNIFLMEMSSYDYAEQTSKNLGLSKSWGLPEAETSEKILHSLKLQIAKSPDLIVIEISGLENRTAVKIINELCTVHAKQQAKIASQEPKFNILIVEPAK